MNYRVEVSPTVRKEIRELPGHVRALVRQMVQELALNPRPPRARELRGKPNIYCLWLAGRWRIVYQVDDDCQRIRIWRVRLKAQIDYPSIGS